MLVASGILASNLLWLLDKELTTLDDLLRVNHIVDGREEHSQLISAANEGELKSDFLLRYLEELGISEWQLKVRILLYQLYRAKK